MQDTLVGHSAAYSKTLEAGRHLYESAKDSEHHKRLQTELQDLEEAWDKTQSRVDGGRDLVAARVQVRFQLSAQKRSSAPLNDRSNHIKENSASSPYQVAQNTPVSQTGHTREEKTETFKK